MDFNYKNMMDFSGKSVLITGGAGSMGAEFARAFASCGADIVITDICDTKADYVVDTCKALGAKIHFIKANLLEVSSINDMIGKAVRIRDKIDILCNHAGFNNRKPAIEYSEKEWDELIGVDLKAMFFVATGVGRYMLDKKCGKVVNTASVSAVRGHKNLSIYAAAKGGIVQMTKVLAHEWAESNINVNAVGPGYVVTKQTSNYVKDKTIRDNLLAHIPMKRLGETHDIASTVLFLASRGSDYITGQTIYVEGGRLID